MFMFLVQFRHICRFVILTAKYDNRKPYITSQSSYIKTEVDRERTPKKIFKSSSCVIEVRKIFNDHIYKSIIITLNDSCTFKCYNF